MAARVIHFGIDDCHRLKVLRTAGYDIDPCSNLIQFRAALESQAEADAIMVDDSDGSVPDEVISLARSRCTAPIILFPHATRSYEAQAVDLVVPVLRPPHEWLLDLANIIIRTRALQASSRLLQAQSQRLCREAAAECDRSARERKRSRRERARNQGVLSNHEDPLGGP